MSIAWGLTILAALAAVYMLNRTAFRRALAAGRAQLGRLGRAAWGYDPIAVKNAEIDRKAEEVAEATRGLESCRGLINGVERQVESGRREANRLQALAEQYVREGKDDLALERLAELERVQADLAANEGQLEAHRRGYEVYLAKIKSANRRIVDLRRDSARQGVQLRMAKAEANIARLGTAMGRDINLDNLGEIDAEIQSQIDANRARGQVAQDLAAGANEEYEAEGRAWAAAARERLAAIKAGIDRS